MCWSGRQGVLAGIRSPLEQRSAYPIQGLGIRAPDADAARKRLNPLLPREGANAEVQKASQPLTGLESEFADGFVRLKFASARVIADLPGKPPGPGVQRIVAREHLQLLRSARTEVLIASPYVIPGPNVSEAMRKGASRGVRMVIMTNSLTTTDEPLVHFAYARHRRSLLKMGVTLTELKPMADRPRGIARPGESRGSLARLHAKVSIVDQRWLFMGSMNMDGRSAHWNTELNLLIDSPALSAEATSLLMNEQLPNRYQLRVLDDSDQIEWIGGEEEPEMVHHHEPDARWAQYLRLTLLSMFVSEDLL